MNVNNEDIFNKILNQFNDFDLILLQKLFSKYNGFTRTDLFSILFA